MDRPVATMLAVAALLAAPLRVASAEPPTAAPTTAEPPESSSPAGEPTPEERAKALGWDDETTEQPQPAASNDEAGGSEEGDGEDEDEEEEPEEPDIDDVIEADPDLDKRYGRALGMAIGGGVTAGLGLILAASGAYLVADERWSSDSAGALSNRGRQIGGWVTMSIGLAAIATGVVVMALGLAKRKGVLIEAEARLPPTAFVSPWFGKRSGGLGLSLRF